jgi:hypothetical protein
MQLVGGLVLHQALIDFDLVHCLAGEGMQLDLHALLARTFHEHATDDGEVVLPSPSRCNLARLERVRR